MLKIIVNLIISNHYIFLVNYYILLNELVKILKLNYKLENVN